MATTEEAPKELTPRMLFDYDKVEAKPATEPPLPSSEVARNHVPNPYLNSKLTHPKITEIRDKSKMAAEARAFASSLADLSGLEVLERDERLTSYEATEMLREMDLPRRKRHEKGLKDMLAATVLLRAFLAESEVDPA